MFSLWLLEPFLFDQFLQLRLTERNMSFRSIFVKISFTNRTCHDVYMLLLPLPLWECSANPCPFLSEREGQWTALSTSAPQGQGFTLPSTSSSEVSSPPPPF